MSLRPDFLQNAETYCAPGGLKANDIIKCCGYSTGARGVRRQREGDLIGGNRYA
jgi:hypothetical protein